MFGLFFSFIDMMYYFLIMVVDKVGKRNLSEFGGQFFGFIISVKYR